MIVPRHGYHLAGFQETEEVTTTSSTAPSRALWFVLGAVTAFLGPTLLHVAAAGGRRAARKLDQ